MTAHKLLFVTFQLSLCALLAQAAPNSTTSATADTTTPDPDPINQALGPLYTMTNGFIHAVFPNGIRIDTIESVLNLFEPGAAIDGLALTSTILDGYAGFATCVVVGLLLVVLMPLIGCFCCCCRACDKCGGKTHQTDPSNAKCKRILCIGLLLIFTLCTVAAIVMIFFSSARLYGVVEDGTVEEGLTMNLNSLSDSVHRTVEKDINGKIDDILSRLNDSVNTQLRAVGPALTAVLLSNLTHVEQPVDDLARELDGVNKTLDLLIDSMKTFEEIREGTEKNFTQAHALIQNTSLASISPIVSSLENLSNVTASLSANETINSLESGVKAQLENIPNLREAYKEVNSTVADIIEDNFNKSGIYEKVPDAIQDVSVQVKAATAELTQTVNEVLPNTDEVSQILRVVADYAEFVWYGCLAMGCIVGLIALLYMCGLMFGCGERPGPDANFCNKGCGAKCLLAAVGFTFIFYAVLMLLTTALFSVGSLSTSHVCWTLQDPGNTSNSLKDSDLSIPGSNITIQSIVQAYSGCLDQQGIGSIVNELNIGFSKESLTTMVEDQLANVNIEQEIDNINIDTSGLNFLPSNLNDSLDGLKNFNDFNSSIIPNMTDQVETLKSSINVVLALINSTVSSSSPPELFELQDILLHAKDIGLDMMTAAADDVRNDIVVIENSQDNLLNASESAIEAITKAQDSIVNNGSDLVKKVLKDEVADIMGMITEDVNDGIDELFEVQCDDIAESVQNTANVICDTVLDPWNALWFSLGWALIMLIPCLIIALFTASLFRREHSYDGSDYKEDLNRPYDRDDIPLESRGGPNHHYLHGDNTNRAFRDDYGQHMYNGGGGYRHNKHPGSRMAYY